MPAGNQMLMRVVRTHARDGKWQKFEREMFEKAPNTPLPDRAPSSDASDEISMLTSHKKESIIKRA
jgi:hypothetical protein